jgi:hypothetical protein
MSTLNEIRSHTIYHIPTEWIDANGKRKKPKVGCSVDFSQRIGQYRSAGYSGDIEVLEIVVGTAKEAGDHEWGHADRRGYPRGTHYAKNWNRWLSSETRSANGKLVGRRYGSIHGKIYGKINGPNNARAMNSKLTPEQRSKAGRMGGLVGGRIAAKSGHLRRIATRESCAKGGSAAGKATKGYRWVKDTLTQRPRFLPAAEAQSLVDSGQCKFGMGQRASKTLTASSAPR